MVCEDLPPPPVSSFSSCTIFILTLTEHKLTAPRSAPENIQQLKSLPSYTFYFPTAGKQEVIFCESRCFGELNLLHSELPLENLQNVSKNSLPLCSPLNCECATCPLSFISPLHLPLLHLCPQPTAPSSMLVLFLVKGCFVFIFDEWSLNVAHWCHLPLLRSRARSHSVMMMSQSV